MVYDTTSGVICIVVFSISNIGLLISWMMFISKERKFYKRLKEGYYFIEDNYRWRRRRLLMVHPSNIDQTLDIPRIIDPALIIS
ncbi:unnamed protein product [Ceutorhynchus assimilis]|uniref:Uncharacterized protein n=1 Tax=Ceutorhynchus assimilis TaxID=467358 RepID=A0A9N9MTV3_9CUCU|nr:unnamed protein product [Ceutorhynchus assimilis]